MFCGEGPELGPHAAPVDFSVKLRATGTKSRSELASRGWQTQQPTKLKALNSLGKPHRAFSFVRESPGAALNDTSH